MKNDIKALIALIITYSVGNFLLLLNRGIYWDGWFHLPLILEKSPLLDYLANEQRLYTLYYLFKFLELTKDPVFFIKLLSFTSWLLAGIFLYGILRKKLNLRIDRSFFISAFFILTPVYMVKVESAMVPYSINNMLFFLATFIYFLSEKNGGKLFSIIIRAASWIIFFLSFFTPSLLVFYGGFLLLILSDNYYKNNKEITLSLLWQYIKINFPFIILPVFFWTLKETIWRPSGIWSDYNQFISLKDALWSFNSYTIIPIWNTIVFGFFWPIVAPITILSRKIFTSLFFIFGSAIYLLIRKTVPEERSVGTDFSPANYLISGIILFFLGFLPYLLVGKSPHIYGDGFDMRHALLLPLGSSLIILGTVLTVIRENWQTKIQVLILSLFMIFTFYNYYGLDMDHYKQLAVIESLKTNKNDSINNASTLIFHDRVPLNWMNRSIHSEEYLGYLKEIYKDNPKFAISEFGNIDQEYEGLKLAWPNTYPPKFDPKEKITAVSIVSSANYELPTAWNWLELKKYELFYDNWIFMEKLKEKLKIEVIAN